MSLVWLDTKYVLMLSSRLRNFKRKGDNSYNMSCPFCGDSKNDKRKARGYIYYRKGKLRYHCHNCGVPGIDIPKLVKHLDVGLYDEYVKEMLMAKTDRKPTELEEFTQKLAKPSFIKDTPLNSLKKISQFSPDSVVKKYVDGRRIPPPFHSRLFFCKEFKKWVNQFKPGQFESEDHDEPRLIIPLIDQEGNLFAIQGRSFRKNSNLRYITIMFDEEKPKLYGLDRVDVLKPIYVVEGPIDSMFLPNCIAAAGSDITSNLTLVTPDISKFTIIFDIEHRNKEITTKIERAIDKGYRVCLWPNSVASYGKDVNDLVLSGFSQQKIVDIIENNSYSGLQAKAVLTSIKRC